MSDLRLERSADDSAEIQALAARLVEVEAELASKPDLQVTLDAVIRERDELRGALDGARAELADVRGSTSWRVTAPLRAISARVRGH